MDRHNDERGLLRGDSGVTLTELLVALGVFTAVIAVFMAGVVTMTKNTARAVSVSDTGSVVRTVFQRMDKEVRYASSINRPGKGPSGAYYVEYLIQVVEGGKPQRCIQWRVTADRKLQRREATGPSGSGATGWYTFSDGVRNDLNVPAQLPFRFSPADNVYANQRLKVVLEVAPNASQTGSGLETEFVARNTSSSSTTNADLDDDGRSDIMTCTGMGRD
ncbi:hypothetical protein ATL41_0340 [Flavimobilis soli]|uniref:Prepilin-type N-terminal cleavage/methylation domain-containing protein n=1 Tax=Flavimobilis soli TaxID=442709 RepID=A0A2A9EBJ0_9MICO|nr:hypothetical protein [Flavimobilis soli]PFG35645.1 hypothetical protein ATL41_0340 [Flavimobilis soli]